MPETDPTLSKRQSVIAGDFEFAAKPITMRPDGDREIRMLVDFWVMRDGRHSHVATFDLAVDEWDQLNELMTRAVHR